MAGADVCRLLDWDSGFFGRRIARVAASRLDPGLARDVLAWCAERRVDCVYFLADDEADTVRAAEDAGFRHVDVRVTLERGLDDAGAASAAPAGVSVRAAAEADVPALRALARVSHTDSRFYHDPGFAKSRCDALYETWIERSCHGYADAVLVLEHGGTAVGYVSCHLGAADEGSIGLFAVGAGQQGRGAGRALLGESLRWFAAHGRRRVSVVTQGRNVAAQRLYQRGGFVTRALQLWYHRWWT